MADTKQKKNRKKNLSFREKALIWLLFQKGYGAADIRYFLYENKTYDISLQRIHKIRGSGLFWSENDTTLKQQKTAYAEAEKDLQALEDTYREGLRNVMQEELDLYNSSKYLAKKRIDNEEIDNSSLARILADTFNRLSLITGNPTEITKTLGGEDITQISDEDLTRKLCEAVKDKYKIVNKRDRKSVV